MAGNKRSFEIDHFWRNPYPIKMPITPKTPPSISAVNGPNKKAITMTAATTDSTLHRSPCRTPTIAIVIGTKIDPKNPNIGTLRPIIAKIIIKAVNKPDSTIDRLLV